jgi:hypothetical protein
VDRESARLAIYNEDDHGLIHAAIVDPQDGPSLLRILSEYDVDFNAQDITVERSRPIHFIVERWEQQDVEDAIKDFRKQIDINSANEFGMTALSLAVASTEPRLALIKFLMKKKAQFPDDGPPEIPPTPQRRMILKLIKLYEEVLTQPLSPPPPGSQPVRRSSWLSTRSSRSRAP